MTGFIPREKLTAYQRWELAAFDEEEETNAEEIPSEPPAPESGPTDAAVPEDATDAGAEMPGEAVEEIPAIALPTAADIERIHEEAREQGHAEGQAEGYAEGRAEGYEEGRAQGREEGRMEGREEGRVEGREEGRTEGMAEGREASARIAEILGGLGGGIEEIEQKLADQLLALALEIASQVLRQSLKVKPELILPAVREAISALQLDSGRPVLLAHPDDAALIRAQLGEHLAHNDWRIIDDGTLTRGGCRVELGASEVDATLETRWKRALRSMGSTSEWLDESP